MKWFVLIMGFIIFGVTQSGVAVDGGDGAACQFHFQCNYNIAVDGGGQCVGGTCECFVGWDQCDHCLYSDADIANGDVCPVTSANDRASLVLTNFINAYSLMVLGEGDILDGDDILNKGKGAEFLLFLISSYVGTVVLLNLLISILGDTYERIQETASLEFWRERAELVTDMWSIPLWNIPQNLGLHDDENIDRYLHAVLPTAWIDEHGEVLGHDECEGTFRRVRRVLEKHRKEDIKHREAEKV
jgi:hypothetical protein